LLTAWFISDKLLCLPAYKRFYPTFYYLVIHPTVSWLSH